MSSDLVKVIKFSELNSVSDRLIVRVVDFFRDENVLSKMLSEAVARNHLTLPSIYGEGNACCVQGFFCGQNTLVFRDGVQVFFITQLSSLLYGIFDIGGRVFYSQERNPGRQDILIRALLAWVDVKRSSHGKFLGIINGYQRPYHYFYDKIPFLYTLESSLLSRITFLTVRDKAFLPASFFGGENEVVVDDLSGYIDNHEGFAIDIGHPYGFNKKSHVNDILDSKIKGAYEVSKVTSLSGVNGGPVIWFGVCQEKRQWVELLDAVKIFIDRISFSFPNALFVFDGLTRPEYVDEVDFIIADRVRRDVQILEKIVSESKLNNYVSLVGKTAKEKLFWAFKTDFFISNALTDSMWCSRFAMKPGVCFSSGSSQSEVLRQHRHPKAHLFPFEHVHDLGDECENWSKMDFSIEPGSFVDFTFSILKESMTRRSSK